MSYHGQAVYDMDSHIREYEEFERTYGPNIDPAYREPYQQYLEVAPRGVYADDARRALDETVKPTNSPPQRRRRGR